MLAIVDYRVGNLHNLKNALDHLGLPNQIVRTPEALQQADRLLLPGVGAFAPAMQALQDSEMLAAMQERVQAGTPLLGICVGAQLLFESGHEDGPHAGLGWLGGEVVRFAHALKIPQMGWNEVQIERGDLLFRGIRNRSHFYFVHSFHFQPTTPEHVLGSSDYGYRFAAVVRRENVWGVQFHPEKSQAVGLQLLHNFGTLT